MKAIGENKRCSVCAEWKHVSEFHVSKHKSDGLKTECKPCSRQRTNRYYADNREKILEKNRTKFFSWYQKNREYQAAYRIKQRVKYRLMEEILASQGITL